MNTTLKDFLLQLDIKYWSPSDWLVDNWAMVQWLACIDGIGMLIC